jgi:hypothetical protein
MPASCSFTAIHRPDIPAPIIPTRGVAAVAIA